MTAGLLKAVREVVLKAHLIRVELSLMSAIFKSPFDLYLAVETK